MWESGEESLSFPSGNQEVIIIPLPRCGCCCVRTSPAFQTDHSSRWTRFSLSELYECRTPALGVWVFESVAKAGIHPFSLCNTLVMASPRRLHISAFPTSSRGLLPTGRGIALLDTLSELMHTTHVRPFCGVLSIFLSSFSLPAGPARLPPTPTPVFSYRSTNVVSFEKAKDCHSFRAVSYCVEGRAVSAVLFLKVPSPLLWLPPLHSVKVCCACDHQFFGKLVKRALVASNLLRVFLILHLIYSPFNNFPALLCT